MFTNLEALIAAAAKAGQATLALADGEYDAAYVRKVVPTRPLTITGAKVVLHGLTLQASANLTFVGVEIATPALPVDPKTGVAPLNGVQLVSVQSGNSNIAFDRCKIHGSRVGDGAGVFFRDSPGCSLTNSEIFNCSVAVQHLNADHLTISNNVIHDLVGDAIKGGGGSFVMIAGNQISDMYPADGDHPDGVQFWTVGTTASIHDITITGNQLRRGKGQPFQSVFMGNEAGLPYLNVTVSDNLLMGGMWHGLSIYQAAAPVVTGNYVQGEVDSVSAGQVMTPWVLLDHCTGGTVANNTTASVILTGSTGITPTGTVTIKNAPAGDYSASAAWLKAAGGLAVSVPPAVNPLQAQLDAANVKVTALQAQVLTLQGQLTATQTALVADQTILASIAKLANASPA